MEKDSRALVPITNSACRLMEDEASSVHILVVDDDEPFGRMLENAIVKMTGFACSLASDAKQALEFLARNHADVVITDIKMPDINGLELTRIIKTMYDSDVIILTGYYEDFTFEDAIDNGANDFIEKPLNPMELVIRLKRVLRERAILYQRKQAENELRKFKTISDEAGYGASITDLEGNFIYNNAAFAIMHGYKPSELKEKHLSIFNTGRQMKDLNRLLDQLKREGSFVAEEVWHRRKDNTEFPASMTAMLIRDENGEPQFMAYTAIDITELKRAQEEEKRKMEEENFRYCMDNSPLGIRVVTAEGEILYANRAILDIYGLNSFEELKTTPANKLYTPESFAEYLIRKEKIKGGEDYPSEYEMTIVRKDGQSRHLHVFRKDILWNGEKHFQVIFNDITTRKLVEERLRASLKEKEILINEVHHRVKNNMQVISSLLDLQVSSTEHPELAEMLRENQRRIRSMALVHEKLYGTKDFARIDLAGYLRTLSHELFRSCKTNSEKIKLLIEIVGEVYVDINKAIPCGMILNELISNALKHAFPGDRQGELKIMVSEINHKEIQIAVRDNGANLPENIDIYNPKTIGLHLVNGLVKNQLHGQIDVRRGGGTEFRIRFSA